jgi:hypothetical protein
MRKTPDKYENLAATERLEKVRAEFSAALRAVSEANLKARADNYRDTTEMQEKAKYLSTVEQRLKEAKADLELVTGGPDIVASTPLVVKKVRLSFPSEHDDVIRLLEKEIGRNLPYREKDSAEDLERVRLAVLKIASGSLAELRRQIDIAKVDWRDVLNSAEYPEASGMSLVDYKKLDEQTLRQLKTRDRQQYLAWLNDDEKLS